MLNIVQSFQSSGDHCKCTLKLTVQHVWPLSLLRIKLELHINGYIGIMSAAAVVSGFNLESWFIIPASRRCDVEFHECVKDKDEKIVVKVREDGLRSHSKYYLYCKCYLIQFICPLFQPHSYRMVEGNHLHFFDLPEFCFPRKAFFIKRRQLVTNLKIWLI